MQVDPNVAAALQRANEAWATGKDRPPGPPDAVYELQLVGAETRVSKGTPPKLISLWEWCVVGGEMDGELFTDMISLEMESWAYRLAQRMRKLDATPPETAEEIPAALEQLSLVNPIVRAQVRHSGDFINVTVQELIDAAPQPRAKPGATPAQAASPFQINTDVSLQYEGGLYIGKITAIDQKLGQATVVGEGPKGRLQFEEVKLEDLTLAEPTKPTPAPKPVPAGPAPTPVPEKATPTLAPVAAPTPVVPPPKKSVDDKVALYEFFKAQRLETQEPQITEQATAKELVEVLNTYDWDGTRLAPSEKMLLNRNGIGFKEPEAATMKA